MPFQLIKDFPFVQKGEMRDHYGDFEGCRNEGRRDHGHIYLVDPPPSSINAIRLVLLHFILYTICSYFFFFIENNDHRERYFIYRVKKCNSLCFSIHTINYSCGLICQL